MASIYLIFVSASQKSYSNPDMETYYFFSFQNSQWACVFRKSKNWKNVTGRGSRLQTVPEPTKRTNSISPHVLFAILKTNHFVEYRKTERKIEQNP